MLYRIILILILITPIVYAQGDYADLVFDIDSQGNVLFSGIDSTQDFILNKKLPSYTSKNGEYWILNITSKTSYESFIFESIFPEGTLINYVKTTPNFRIDDEDGRIKLIGTGENKPITLIVQYKIETNTQKNLSDYLPHPMMIGVIGIFLGIFFSFFIKSKVRDVKEKKAIRKEIDVAILPERQKDIIKFLKIKGKVTQKELETYMQIPKASVSRNVKTLEIKGFILKENVGNTNYLSINQKYK